MRTRWFIASDPQPRWHMVCTGRRGPKNLPFEDRPLAGPRHPSVSTRNEGDQGARLFIWSRRPVCRVWWRARDTLRPANNAGADSLPVRLEQLPEGRGHGVRAPRRGPQTGGPHLAGHYHPMAGQLSSSEAAGFSSLPWIAARADGTVTPEPVRSPLVPTASSGLYIHPRKTSGQRPRWWWDAGRSRRCSSIARAGVPWPRVSVDFPKELRLLPLAVRRRLRPE